MKWSDVDFSKGTITIRGGKAKRVDVISMHSQLAEEMERRRDESLALPLARVFPEAVTSLTVLKDFLRAGLARKEVVTDPEGKTVMIGKGKWKRPKTRIVPATSRGGCSTCTACGQRWGRIWLAQVWRRNWPSGSCGTATTGPR